MTIKLQTIRGLAFAAPAALALMAGCDSTPDAEGKGPLQRAGEKADAGIVKAKEKAKEETAIIKEKAKETGEKIKEEAKVVGDKIKEEAKVVKDAAEKAMDKVKGTDKTPVAPK